MFAVGEYTMAPWKVMWPEVGYEVEAAVCGPEHSPDPHKIALATHTIIAISCDEADEAYFTCALLNCSPARLLFRGYVVLHPSPHVLERIAMPEYRRGNTIHRSLAKLSRRAHKAAARGRAGELEQIEAEIDQAAAKLWGLTSRELSAVRRALKQEHANPRQADDSELLDLGAP